MSVRWVGYTTRYRSGGALLQQAARTLAAELREAHPGDEVRCEAVETKRAFVDAMGRVGAGQLVDLHFVGHSGMYGPMFGTTALPEQFSPHEWTELSLNFAAGARASFHACRTGRWFSTFFANCFGVACGGNFLYTTFSRRPDRFVPVRSARGPVYVIAQPGRTSHGWWGALGKRAGWLRPEPMRYVQATSGRGREVARRHSYDPVADAYDRAFADIRVRVPEWAWLQARVPAGASLLDVGCGTGALLRALAPRLARGVGVDASEAMLAHARRRGPSSLSFVGSDGPRLPFPDDHFDVVTSLLSWRYLDWDPMLREVQRVLRPGGRLLVVDMVTRPAALGDLPAIARGRWRIRDAARRYPSFHEDVRALVSLEEWSGMLAHHPIRAEHELRWFFESRFPGTRCETLDVGWTDRVLAFDSGPVSSRWLPPQSFP